MIYLNSLDGIKEKRINMRIIKGYKNKNKKKQGYDLYFFNHVLRLCT